MPWRDLPPLVDRGPATGANMSVFAVVANARSHAVLPIAHPRLAIATLEIDV